MTKSIRSRFIVSFLLLSQMAFAGALRKQEADSLISSDHSKTWSLPAAADTLLGRTSTDTVTNKSLSGSSNTFTNIPAGSALSGQVPIANGGTNLSSYAAGQLIYASATNVLTQLSVGSAGQILQSVGGFPAWGTTFTSTTSYTITSSGWGGAGTYSAFYKRMGDCGIFSGSIRLTTAPTGTFQFSQADFFGSLSISMDSAKLPGQTDTQIAIGIWEGYHNGAANYSGGVYIDTANSNQIIFQNNASGTVNATSPFTWGNTDSITWYTQVIPISGWN